MGELTLSDTSRLLHLVVTTGDHEVDVIGVYVPSGGGDMMRKRAFLEELARATSHWPDDRPALMAGDFYCAPRSQLRWCHPLASQVGRIGSCRFR